MRIINSPVRSIHLFHPNFIEVGHEVRPEVLAKAKKIARKRDRAQMRTLATKELLQEHMAIQAEQREEARLERVHAYNNLMRNLRRRDLEIRGYATPARVKESSGENRIDFDTWAGIRMDPVDSDEARLAIRMECLVDGVRRELTLASCAAID